MEGHADGERKGGALRKCPDRRNPTLALRSRVLHLSGISYNATLQRKRDVVRAQTSSNSFSQRDQTVFEVVSKRCAANATVVRPRRVGKQVTARPEPVARKRNSLIRVSCI